MTFSGYSFFDLQQWGHSWSFDYRHPHLHRSSRCHQRQASPWLLLRELLLTCDPQEHQPPRQSLSVLCPSLHQALSSSFLLGQQAVSFLPSQVPQFVWFLRLFLARAAQVFWFFGHWISHGECPEPATSVEACAKVQSLHLQPLSQPTFQLFPPFFPLPFSCQVLLWRGDYQFSRPHKGRLRRGSRRCKLDSSKYKAHLAPKASLPRFEGLGQLDYLLPRHQSLSGGVWAF